MFIRKKEYEGLQEEVARLRAERDDYRRRWLNKETEIATDYLKDYQYAILMPLDGYVPKIWNQGRFEENIKEIEFSSGYRYYPELKIKK